MAPKRNLLGSILMLFGISALLFFVWAAGMAVPLRGIMYFQFLTCQVVPFTACFFLSAILLVVAIALRVGKVQPAGSYLQWGAMGALGGIVAVYVTLTILAYAPTIPPVLIQGVRVIGLPEWLNYLPFPSASGTGLLLGLSLIHWVHSRRRLKPQC